MVDAPRSEADLRQRYLVPYVPASVERPQRAANQAVVRWQPGEHAPALAAHDSLPRGVDAAPSGGGGGAPKWGGTSDHRSAAPCPEARPRDAEAAEGMVHARAVQAATKDDSRPTFKDAAAAGCAAHADAAGGLRAADGA
eukprot:3484858-Prymnesium_polylepis.1